MTVTHEEETRNFVDPYDPINDYCERCLCSFFCCDDECECECHDDLSDPADGEDDSIFGVAVECSCGANVGEGESHSPECPYA